MVLCYSSIEKLRQRISPIDIEVCYKLCNLKSIISGPEQTDQRNRIEHPDSLEKQALKSDEDRCSRWFSSHLVGTLAAQVEQKKQFPMSPRSNNSPIGANLGKILTWTKSTVIPHHILWGILSPDRRAFLSAYANLYSAESMGAMLGTSPS